MADQIRITSISNQIIKEVRSLRNKKGRISAQSILLEGYRLVKEAVDSGAEIRYFIVSDSFLAKEEFFLSQVSNIRVVQVPDELFGRISETQTPQGIIAVAKVPIYNQKDIIKNASQVIVLENLQDPGNLGTIIRSADACGFDAVLLSKESADPYNPKVIRSTMGSIFHIPVIIVEDIYQVLDDLKARKVFLAAAHTRDALPCWNADMSGNVAIIIGNEGNGLSDMIIEKADRTIMIPMTGRAESLNASAAASMLIYECMRQRVKNKIC
ncbi:MAG: RNA methyltransferase [Clostridiaceae bacterium]|jgi:TrmH family RNA methyltransferase|nr:RNA methyltransferase [Clostridiaceae bacterium]